MRASSGRSSCEWDAPDRLLEVGIGVDRFGVAVERVEPGELDQAQHDEGREVFAVPGGCMLGARRPVPGPRRVRPRHRALRRGRGPVLAGPGGRSAGRRRAFGPCPPRTGGAVGIEDASATLAMLRRRHELRAVLKNYDRPRRLLVVLDLAAGSIAEVSVRACSGASAPRAKRVGGRLVVELAPPQEPQDRLARPWQGFASSPTASSRGC